MLWANVNWSERLTDFASFHRFLAIPLLLAQFRRSEHGMRVLVGFFLSVSAVLLFSVALALFPAIPWQTQQFGVPVKDYILQSEDFVLCAFVLLAIALDDAGKHRWRPAIGLAAFAFCFLADIVFVVTGRTADLVAAVLTVLLGWRQRGWRGSLGAGIMLCVLGTAGVIASPYMRERLATSITELRAWQTDDAVNSTALHLQFLKEGFSFVETAPVIGHGTGSIAEQYRKEAVGQSGAAAVASVNPHNQTLAVAIQLGLIGAAVLLAMWAAHFMLFRGGGLVGWIGVVIVTDNVVSCLVNSHLFDF